MFIKLTNSPIVALSNGYIFMLCSGIILYFTGFFNFNTYFKWGTPVTVMGTDVTNPILFYILLAINGLYQLINSWNEVTVYPFIMNEIQDRKCKIMSYNTITSLSITVLYDIFGQLGILFMVNGAMSQISFLIVNIAVGLITTTLINYKHIIKKNNLFIPETSLLMSPIVSLTTGYLTMIISTIILYKMNFFNFNTYFTWGVPVSILGKQITTHWLFWTLLIINGLQQLFETWNDSTVYPYILNEIQDNKCKNMKYNMFISISIALLYDIYCQIGMVFMINGTMSQVSFLIVTTCISAIVTLYVNYKHIKSKDDLITVHKYSTSPILALSSGYLMLVISIIVLYYMDFFNNNTYFNWGVPIEYMGNNVTNIWLFYLLLVIDAVYQFVSSWNEVITYPYIINEIQDKKCEKMKYGMITSLFIAAAYNIFEQLDMLLMVNGSLSQVSFLIVNVIINAIVTIYINTCFIYNKMNDPSLFLTLESLN